MSLFYLGQSMPTAPAKLCSHPGCNAKAIINGKCPAHQPKPTDAPIKRERTKDKRPSAHKRGYDYRWNQARLAFLDEHPLCKHCQDKDMIVAATVVDHIIPHRGDQSRFWNQDNWQPLCKSCHDIKTATIDRKLTTALLPNGKAGGAVLK